MQPVRNELMHLVAHDTEFLRQTLGNTIKVDEFTGNLFKIYEKVLAEGGPIQVRYSHQKSISDLTGNISWHIPFGLYNPCK